MNTQADQSPLDHRIRVLLVQRQSGGGSIVSLVELARALTRQSVEPTVLLTSGGGHYEEQLRSAGIEVISFAGAARSPGASIAGRAARLKSVPLIRDLNRFLRSDIRLARRIAQVIGSGRYDLVHHNVGLRVDRASIIATARIGLPQVAHVRAFERYHHPLDTWTSRIPDHVIFVSQAVRDYCNDHLKTVRTKGSVIYNAVEVAHYESGQRRRDEVRATLGIGANARVIAAIGRIVRWKGQGTLISATGPLLRERPDLQVILVGAPGSDPDSQQYYQELTTLIGETRLGDRIRMVGFQADIPGVLAAADVIVHTSTKPEPFGRVPIEAMAASRPVVGTAAGGVEEVIGHGENGLLVPPGDTAALRAALVRLLDDAAFVDRLVRNGRRHVEERFSADRLGREVAEVYRRVLPVPRQGRAGGTEAERLLPRSVIA